MTNVEDYDFTIPPELIAQRPRPFGEHNLLVYKKGVNRLILYYIINSTHHYRLLNTTLYKLYTLFPDDSISFLSICVTNSVEHTSFEALPSILRSGDLLILNDTKGKKRIDSVNQ